MKNLKAIKHMRLIALLLVLSIVTLGYTTLMAKRASADDSVSTVVLNSNFEPGDPTVWTLVNAAATNSWFIGTATNNGGTQAAYVTSDGGATNSYVVTTQSTNHIYTPVTFPAGETAIILSFDWKGVAEPSAVGGSTFDYIRVSLSTTAPTAGTFPATTDQLPVIFTGQPGYVKAWVVIPAANAGTTKNLIFTWRNDTTLGNPTPGPAIDNVMITSNAPAALAGTKTIQAGGDYTSFGQAIANLDANGVGAGGVTFNVAAGTTYNETPPAITATGTAANPIVFQKNGAGANPLITSTGTGNFGPVSTGSVAGGGDAVINIQGADFVTFDGIDTASGNFTGTSSDIEAGYLLRNLSATDGAQNNTIKNFNVTLNRTVASATVGAYGVQQSISTNQGGVTPTAATGSNSNNKYYNFTVSNAYAGVWLQGNSTFPDDLCEVGVTGAVTQNTIGAATANDIGNGTVQTWGIRATAQSNAKIFSNEVRNVTGTGATVVDGIFLDNSGAVTISVGTVEIYKNKVHDIKNTSTSTTSHVLSGIRANLTGSATSVSRIYNNFVYGLDNQSGAITPRQIIGIRIQDGGSGVGATHNIDFNSVRLAPTGLTGSNTTFEIGTTSGPTINVRNNVFANFTGAQTATSKHYTWVTPSGTLTGIAGSVSNRNVLYVANTTNGFTGLTNATDQATLANWQTATSQDANSFSQDPKFVSATDLHIQTGVPTPVESNGSFFGGAITWVTTDIDMETRNVTTPDIGADEGNFTPLPANDIGVVAIIVPAPGSVVLNGAVVTPQASFTNAGTANQTNVMVRFTITGPGGYSYMDTQTIPTLNAGQTVTVTFAAAPAFTTAGTYTATATNLFADSNTANDAVMANFTVANPLAGNYNVGAGGDFTSLTNTGGVFDSLNTVGASAPVTINITSDLSGETGTVALNELASGSAVTIKPTGAARTITGSSTVGIIRINGADNVTIDGSLTGGSATGVGGDATLRNLTVVNTNTVATAGAVIIIQQGANSANNDTVKNVNVSGQDPTQTLIGIHIGGNAPGTSPTVAANTNCVVDNCSFVKSFIGIFNNGVSAAIPGTGMVISHNDLSATGANRMRRAGIFFFAQNGINVFENKIGGIVGDEAADAIGIIAGIQNVTTTSVTSGLVYNANITRNKIDVITSTNTTGFSAVGIAIAGDPLGPNTISNNMISGVNAPSTSPDLVAGIFVAGVPSSSTKLYHNSVSMTGNRGAVASQIGSYAIAISGTDPTVDLRNNIFYTTQTSGGGAAAKSYALGMQTTTFVNLTSNFNDFFFSGAQAGGFRTGSLDTTGTDLATLAAWQGASGKDANSLNVDPLFVDPITNLHLQTTSPMKDAGTTGLGITVDIDNQTRDAMPDIGADELVAGTLALSSATYTVGEAAGNLTVTVNRTGGTDGAVSVSYTLTDGTATGGAACGAGVDYVNTGGTVNFANGQASQTFMVPICNDAAFEGNETFNITISSPTGGATLGTPSSAVATITDDDAAMPGTLAFSSPTYTIGEAGGTATITVNRTGGTDGAVSVGYATVAGGTATGGASCGAGVDYINASGTLNWANGDSAPKTFTVTICNDSLDEADETVNLALSNATGGATIGAQSTAVLTITDDDATPTIAIVSPSPTAEGNSGTTPFVFNVNLSAPSGQTVTVHYSTADGTATAPSDYTAIPDTVLTFTPGQTNKQITVLVNGDTNFEGNETFFVNLSMPTNATLSNTQGTGTILNDDAATGTVTINDVRTLEGDSGSHTVTFTATLTTPSTPPANASVQYSTGGGTATPGASPPADYQAASGTLFFGAPTEGETSGGTDGSPVITTRTFTVTIFGDTNKEENETFFVTLSNPVALTIGDGTGVGIIVDDDRARVSNFDGDLTSDLAVFRPSNTNPNGDPNESFWYILQSSNSVPKFEHFGANGDIAVPGDYDGDSKTDLAVFRPSNGTWYIEQSSNFQFRAQSWGLSSDIPAQGDFDGDGKTDIAVFRPSNGTWYILQSFDNSLRAVPFGANGDKPVQGDFDGDAKADIAVFRPSTGTWYVTPSTGEGQVIQTTWGAQGDKPVIGDFDGDGSTDYAVFRPSTGTWYILQSLTGTVRTEQWGTNGDIPVIADYDGDGTSDVAVWRPSDGNWYTLKSNNILSRPDAIDYVPEQRHWGQSGDEPVPDGYIH